MSKLTDFYAHKASLQEEGKPTCRSKAVQISGWPTRWAHRRNTQDKWPREQTEPPSRSMNA